MSKIKALFGVTVMVALLAMSASSASAFFASSSVKLEGKGKAGTTEFTDEGATVTCTSAEGQWKLLNATQSKTINIHVNASTAAKPGWKGCTTSIGSKAEVGECELQVSQQAKLEHKGLGAVIKGCEVNAAGCIIKVPGGQEPGGKENEGLKEILGENIGQNLLSKVKVEGITSEDNNALACTLGGITNSKNKTGKEKGEVTGEGVKEV